MLAARAGNAGNGGAGGNAGNGGAAGLAQGGGLYQGGGATVLTGDTLSNTRRGRRSWRIWRPRRKWQ